MTRVGSDQAGRGVYRFLYYFEVDGDPSQNAENKEWILHGTKGEMLADRGATSGFEGFAEFWKQMGHGGTSIQPIPDRWVPQLLALADDAEVPSDVDALDADIAAAESEGGSDDVTTLRAIKTRRGQRAFRLALLEAYEGRCCVTGCGEEALLEAAHIGPHIAGTNYRPSNGLLLRADIHTLYDLHLLGIDRDGQIRISRLVQDSYYRDLEKIGRIRPPRSSKDNPSKSALESRMKHFWDT